MAVFYFCQCYIFIGFASSFDRIAQCDYLPQGSLERKNIRSIGSATLMKTPITKSNAISCDVTPRSNHFLAGRGDGARMSIGNAAALEANFIVFPVGQKFLAVIGIDTLFSSEALKSGVLNTISKSAKSKVLDIVIVANHTHNAPSLDPEKPILGSVDAVYFKQAVQSLSETLEKTLHDPSPDRVIKHGRSQCFANARRRKATLRVNKSWPILKYEICAVPNHATDVPRDLDLFYATDSTGTAKWCLWSWTCHSVSYPDPRQNHPDFPGPVRDHIRSILGVVDLPVVYLPGLAGDIRSDAAHRPNSITNRLMTPLVRPFATATHETFAKLCDDVSKGTDRALAAAEPLKPRAISPFWASKRLPLAEIMTDENAHRSIEVGYLRHPMFDICLLYTSPSPRD